MLVQLFNRGKGRGYGPVEYTTALEVPVLDADGKRLLDADGDVILKRRKPPPQVLRGDPARTEMLIDSSRNQWKYSSGVLAFSDDDNPTEEQQQQLIDDFEATIFVGLERDQYDVFWVRHLHEGNVELHFVVPRIELTTGKALNGFPPGYQQLTDAWRDKWNWSHGWARPDDPDRKRLVKSPGYALKLNKGDLTTREEITEWLSSRIESGMVVNRSDIVASLKEVGEVTRQGRDYISVKLEGFAKTIRLKGLIYGEDFNSERLAEAAHGEAGAGSISGSRVDFERAEDAAKRLGELVQSRARYHVERYSRSTTGPVGAHGLTDSERGPDRRDDGRGSQKEAERDTESALPERTEAVGESDRPGSYGARSSEEVSRSSEDVGRENDAGGRTLGISLQGTRKEDGSISEEGASALVHRHGDSPDSLASHLLRELGADSILIEPGREEPHDDRRAESSDSDAGQRGLWGQGEGVFQRDIPPAASGDTGWFQVWGSIRDQITSTLKAGYDRVRTAVIEQLASIEQAVRSGYASARAAEQAIDAASERLERATDPLAALLAQLEQSAGKSEFDGFVEAMKQASGPSDVTDGPAPEALVIERPRMKF